MANIPAFISRDPITGFLVFPGSGQGGSPAFGTNGTIQLSNGAGQFTGNAGFNYTAVPITTATGTLTTLNTSTDVVGVGTKFNLELKIGNPLIVLVGAGLIPTTIGTIDTILNNTNLTLVANATQTNTNVNFQTSAFNIVTANADFLPNESNKFGLGNEDFFWKNLNVGPGTITILGKTPGQTADLGLDDNGVAYFDAGVSVPFINVGPQDINPVIGAVGGWKMSPLGDPNIPTTYDLVVQQNSTTSPPTPFGPIYSLIRPIGIMGLVARVDSINGNNTTAIIGGLPFLTIQAAIAAIGAATGITIWILPGTYTLTAGITIPSGCSIRGISVQTVIINLAVTVSTTMITMGTNTRLEDVTCNLTSNTNGVNLTGIEFPGATGTTVTTTSAKLRTMVMNVNNNGVTTGSTSNVFGINCTGVVALGITTTSLFNFNCIKGSTISVLSNGAGTKRALLVSGANTATVRDSNFSVAAPTIGTSTGSYVGVETNDVASLGTVQIRTSTIGCVLPIAGQTFTASDILQTTPATLTNPTYLASAGIQLGPGVDLVTKTAGAKAFSVYSYPLNIYYGLIGTLSHNISSTPPLSYLWPGSLFVSNNANATYPDKTTPPAYFRIPQSMILAGMSASLNDLPAVAKPININIQQIKAADAGKNPIVGLITIPNYSHTFTNLTPKIITHFDTSFNLSTGDYLLVQVDYLGDNAKDLTVQLYLY